MRSIARYLGNSGPTSTPLRVSYGMCEYRDETGECQNPGSTSDSTRGGGPWFCREHAAGARGLVKRRGREKYWADVLVDELLRQGVGSSMKKAIKPDVAGAGGV